MLETNFISAVPLNLTFRSAFFVYQHIRRSLNDCGSRQSILKFRTALESPFHFQCNTAIPPPAALCENTIENVLLFLNGFALLWLYFTVSKLFCQEVFYLFIISLPVPVCHLLHPDYEYISSYLFPQTV